MKTRVSTPNIAFGLRFRFCWETDHNRREFWCTKRAAQVQNIEARSRFAYTSTWIIRIGENFFFVGNLYFPLFATAQPEVEPENIKSISSTPQTAPLRRCPDLKYIFRKTKYKKNYASLCKNLYILLHYFCSAQKYC